MCDFKVGDEVEHVGMVFDEIQKAVFGRDAHPGTGKRGFVTKVWYQNNYWRIHIDTCIADSAGKDPRAWRKVQRRDLTEWLSSSVGNTDKIDKRKRVNA